jgi:hypothetical protein
MTQKKRPFKKHNKPVVKPAQKPNVQKIAETFEADFNKTMQLVPLPDGSIVYKDYVVKENKQGRWVVTRKTAIGVQGEFNLRSSALIAAKSLHRVQLDQYNEIKMLDTRYWNSYNTIQVCRKIIPGIKDFDHYMIMLNKLEHNTWLADNCKAEISKRFRWSFV